MIMSKLFLKLSNAKSKRLCINTDKTQLMLFSKNLAVDSHALSEMGVKLVDSAKFLGIFLDNKLSWSAHTEALCKKLATTSFQLKVLRSLVSQKVLKDVYYAHAYSHISSCIAEWGSSNKLNDIFIWQKKIIRRISGLGRNESCRSKFKEMNLLTVPSIYIYHVLKYVFQNFDEFKTFNNVHSHNTRNKSNIKLENAVDPLLREGSRMYNKLPKHIREGDGNKLLKLKVYLINNEFYSVDDFFDHNVTN